MSTLQETFIDTGRRSQGAFAHSLQSFADSIQKFVGSAPTLDAKMASAKEVVDNYFNVAEEILATQRDFAKSLLNVTTSAAGKVTSAAKDAAKDVQEVTKQEIAKETAPRKS